MRQVYKWVPWSIVLDGYRIWCCDDRTMRHHRRAERRWIREDSMENRHAERKRNSQRYRENQRIKKGAGA